MTLAELLEPFAEAGALPDQAHTLAVGDVEDDSRAIRAGDVFIAVRGAASDGHAYVPQAVAAGAVCVLAEHEVHASVPVVVVDDLAEQRGALVARRLGHPAQAMTCVAVTGTNGKTSVAFHVAELLGALGQRCGFMGTVGWGEPGHLEDSALTTESACTVQRRLAKLRDRGLAWVAYEASSHALDQHRLDAAPPDYAVFTNLSRDHLDYHKTFEAYGAAKRRLFDLNADALAIVNADDAFGESLAADLRARDRRVLTYALATSAEVSFARIAGDDEGQHGVLRTPWGEADVRIPLLGDFAAANVLAAISVLGAAGFELDAIAGAVNELHGVPGRLERFAAPGLPSVVVDFAHTPDAVAKVLAVLRPHCRGRLVCVVGCGGDRDRGKRPLMAQAAEAGADVVWLTSDNPRSEDPDAIIAEMRTGLRGDSCVHSVADRRAAITQAFTNSAPGDLVLLAGKGHEDYQEVAGERLPYSDRELARELLARELLARELLERTSTEEPGGSA